MNLDRTELGGLYSKLSISKKILDNAISSGKTQEEIATAQANYDKDAIAVAEKKITLQNELNSARASFLDMLSGTGIDSLKNAQTQSKTDTFNYVGDWINSSENIGKNINEHSVVVIANGKLINIK